MNKEPLSRRRALRGALALAALAAAGGLARPRAAMAGNGAKTDFQYQDHPQDGQHCAQCAAFQPGPEGEPGSCRLISGAINPNGWCIAFSQR
ncbi:high-potential iron-sulfur protein [Duganella sp. LX20W]|uniref:High-potential iron-sulfur protein n=1 Tax=Rugamonas brunnea TaxID=2758569 RepID=A0A7W2EPT7_9BURK|nr:high-potential iron-sulfur protein [Rugamonas brunnea]MBA5636229.1 high-potential iron-sulfur protein [Rugamonas brunnea]